MSVPAQVGLTILGGFVAGLIGFTLFLVQRRYQQKDDRKRAEKKALSEFREALMPLLIELDRWRYQPGQETVWVGSSRELPALGTWIFDPEENAKKAPDWDSIGQHAQAVERLWRDRLVTRASDSEIDSLWTEASKLLFHLTRRDGADHRGAAEQAEVQIIDLLATIRKEVD